MIVFIIKDSPLTYRKKNYIFKISKMLKFTSTPKTSLLVTDFTQIIKIYISSHSLHLLL